MESDPLCRIVTVIGYATHRPPSCSCYRPNAHVIPGDPAVQLSICFSPFHPTTHQFDPTGRSFSLTFTFRNGCDSVPPARCGNLAVSLLSLFMSLSSLSLAHMSKTCFTIFIVIPLATSQGPRSPPRRIYTRPTTASFGAAASI